MSPTRALLAAAATALLPGIVYAQGAGDAYPVKPVRIVVPAASGGGNEVLTRIFTTKLSESLGKTFIVDPRPGAANMIGTAYVAKSPPDGYTMLAFTAGFCIQPAVLKSLPYDVIKDFDPISLLTKTPFLLVVHPSLPAKSIKELIAIAKSRPGELNAGVGGGASVTQLSMMWFADLAKIKIGIIPYKGTGPVLVELMGGQVQMSFTNGMATLPYIRQGRIRPLAISTTTRSALMPDLPTVAEQGLPGFDFSSWNGWAAPAGTPPAIISKLSVELAKIVRSSEVNAVLAQDGSEAVGSSPEQFRQVIQTELARWKKLVADLKIPLQ